MAIKISSVNVPAVWKGQAPALKEGLSIDFSNLGIKAVTAEDIPAISALKTISDAVANESVDPNSPRSAKLIKQISVKFERFSRTYANNEPTILFVCDYVVEGKEAGCLLVFEKFFDSTHYEVFKKNLFKDNSDFERILFLDKNNLEEETKHYISYIKDFLEMPIDENKVFIILDTAVKQDRIYEYKISAARVPQSIEEVDYDSIIESNGMAKKVFVDTANNATLFDFSLTSMGSKSVAWSIALMNETISFFGITTSKIPLNEFSLLKESYQPYVLTPEKLTDILSIFNDSTKLFGLKPSVSNLIDMVGGLTIDFKEAVLEAIDEEKSLFSYDKFKEVIKRKNNTFDIIASLLSSGLVNAEKELSKLHILLPKESGTESISSVESLSKIFNHVNDTMISVLYGQNSVEQLRQIISDLSSVAAKTETKTDDKAIKEAKVAASPETGTPAVASTTGGPPLARAAAAAAPKSQTMSTTSSSKTNAPPSKRITKARAI